MTIFFIKRSRLASIRNMTYLSGFRAVYSIPKPNLKKFGFGMPRIPDGPVFESPLQFGLSGLASTTENGTQFLRVIRCLTFQGVRYWNGPYVDFLHSIKMFISQKFFSFQKKIIPASKWQILSHRQPRWVALARPSALRPSSSFRYRPWSLFNQNKGLFLKVLEI